MKLSVFDILAKLRSQFFYHLIEPVTARVRQNAAIRKRLETSLYERERVEFALNQHAIVSIADRAGNIIYVNDKFSEISGYSHDELVGQNHRMLKSAGHTPEFYQELWRTISGGVVWQGVICNRRKDGSLYWVESSITPFLDSHGKPYRYVSIRTDISALKENELRLQLQSHAMESSINGILIADARASDMPLIYVNPAFERITGYSANEVLGRNCRFLQGEEHAQPGLAEVRAALHEQRASNVLLRNFRKSGELFWNDLTVAPVRDANGEITHYIGISNDITKRMRAEEEAESSKERLRRGQRFANIGTWDWNIQSGELFWTERIAPLFGYEEGELETSYDNFLAAIHPDDRQAVMDAVNACVERDVPYEIEHRVVWPDGTVRWLLERGGVKRDADGKPIQMLGVVQDIDHRKQAEQALIIAREEADRANKAKSDFLSSMSHELRTPMNAILGFGQLMAYDETLSDERKDDVQEILKAGHHLLELINGVLDLARVESGSIDLSLEPMEVCPVVEECLSLMRTLADRRDIKISHSGLKGVVVRADRMRLRQALLNLLSNAVKYNREGGSVRIEVKRENDERLRILVTDSGKGIPAERMGELFQPFSRLDAGKTNIEGTGIGLTITRRIVEFMGGTVDVESEVGVGSTFWIELPLESASEPLREDAIVANSAPANPIAASQHTLLYIEDNPSNLRLVAQILGRRKHFHLLTAHTTELGIELALARRPDLILLDINMPGMDGFEVLAVLKAEASLKAIPVVAVTANAMPSDIERGMAAGFADYLTKPLDVVKFLAVINHLLASHAETDI